MHLKPANLFPHFRGKEKTSYDKTASITEWSLSPKQSVARRVNKFSSSVDITSSHPRSFKTIKKMFI